MATALDVITRALKRLRVISSGEVPTAEESADCLEALNDMLFEWRIDGIDLAHVALVLTDTIDVPDDHVQALVLNLALRAGGMFGAQLAPADTALALSGEAALRAYHFTIADLSSDSPLSRTNLSNSD